MSANAQSVAAAADNIVNVSTVGYKRTAVATSTLNTRQTTTSSYSAGGVQATPRALADVQGLLASSTRSTDLAISGNGYFVVSNQAQGGQTFYTRDGSFSPDSQGNLVNGNGFYLQARQPGEPNGALSAVNVNAVTGTARATSKISVGANLPANAQAGDVFTVSAQVRDSLGNSHAVQVNFTAQTDNTYKVTIPGAQQTNVAGPIYDVTASFGSDGRVSGFDSNGDGVIDSSTPPGIYIAYSPSSAADLSAQLDLSGVTRFSGDFSLGSVQSDGANYGSVSGVTVSSDGVLSASFDNGATAPIAVIPVATFASPGNLQAVSGNAYRATDGSGDATLKSGGLGGAGSVQGYAQELSTTDLGTEFVSLIVAQSAYTASLKALSAADDLSRSLLSVRA